jgi:DNA (cytosine-5)-methyltransferase 1
MRFGSICSGIEAASVAWASLGWSTAFHAEIEPFCCELLKYHYPGVRNYGDFTGIRESEPIDILVGGTPCQSFSVAGKRAGLDDARGNLTLEYLALAGRLRPRWLLWENVPGVLSDDGGRTFGTVLGVMGELGYGVAYRVLDAQHFGVPQRRRRVFVVGYLGDWRRAAAVLFERACLSGNPAPSRETGEDIALPITSRVDRGGEHREAQGNNLVAQQLHGHHPRANVDENYVITPTLNAHYGDKWGLEDQNALNGGGMFVFDYKQSGETDPTIRSLSHDKSHANGGSHLAVAAFDERNITSKTNRSRVENGAPSHSLHSYAPSIRRLTPRECERLQGFPDDYTLIAYRGKPASDGPRYRALGNSMAVPVMRWIGERIAMVEAIRGL